MGKLAASISLASLILLGCQTEPASVQPTRNATPQRMAGGSATGNALDFLLTEPNTATGSTPPFLALPAAPPQTFGFGLFAPPAPDVCDSSHQSSPQPQ